MAAGILAAEGVGDLNTGCSSADGDPARFGGGCVVAAVAERVISPGRTLVSPAFHRKLETLIAGS
jgi:hypothetical protein